MLISLHASFAKPSPVHCSPRSTGGKAKRFLPFMEGARSCAGQALAVMNLTATLAMMYGSFTFRLAEEVGMPFTDPCQQATVLETGYCHGNGAGGCQSKKAALTLWSTGCVVRRTWTSSDRI